MFVPWSQLPVLVNTSASAQSQFHKAFTAVGRSKPKSMSLLEIYHCRFHEVALCCHSRMSPKITDQCEFIELQTAAVEGDLEQGTCARLYYYWSLVSCWPFVIVYRISSTYTIWETTPTTRQLGLPTELSGSPKHWNPIATCIFPASPVSLLFFGTWKSYSKMDGNLFRNPAAKGLIELWPRKCRGQRPPESQIHTLGADDCLPNIWEKTQGDLVTSTFTQRDPHLNWTGTGSWEPAGSWHWNISESQVDDLW